MKTVLKTVLFLMLVGAIAGGVYLVVKRPHQTGATYYCPMDPGVVSDRPGTCPICNMDLVERKKEGAPAMSAVPDMANVTLDLAQQQKIGVRLGTVARKSLARTIRAVGIVAYDERALSAVSLKVGGWVEELNVKAVGDAVKKGDVLFTLYSPEILEASRNYALAARTLDALDAKAPADARAAAEADLASTRERLLLWDIADAQLAELAAAPATRVAIHAKTSGVVTARTIVKGAFAEPGKNLLELADLAAVWVNAELYEQDAPLVHLGDQATLSFQALPGRTTPANVAFIYPDVNRDTRTLRVRFEVPNPDGALKPGMYADVALAAALGEHLVVESEAVLDTGTRRIVFRATGDGAFEPREVTTGPRADGLTAIIGGLSEGEKIAVSGTFLLDSESRLTAGRSRVGGTP
jgi:membrane fusion protein, copper/silver efflux system